MFCKQRVKNYQLLPHQKCVAWVLRNPRVIMSLCRSSFFAIYMKQTGKERNRRPYLFPILRLGWPSSGVQALTHTHILHCHECSSLHRSVRPAWSIQVSLQHFDSDPNLNGRKLKTNNISRCVFHTWRRPG